MEFNNCELIRVVCIICYILLVHYVHSLITTLNTPLHLLISTMFITMPST